MLLQNQHIRIADLMFYFMSELQAAFLLSVHHYMSLTCDQHWKTFPFVNTYGKACEYYVKLNQSRAVKRMIPVLGYANRNSSNDIFAVLSHEYENVFKTKKVPCF